MGLDGGNGSKIRSWALQHLDERATDVLSSIEADEVMTFNHTERSIELGDFETPAPSQAADSNGHSVSVINQLALEYSC